MAPTLPSRPTRGVPLGLVLVGIVALQIVVVVAAVALNLPILRGGN
jgi:hypothetical protein